MGRIRLLPDPLINQIAAGEVVERPASVVKELVENALDAAASQVIVRLEDGGKEKIQVEDDGCGMDADDAMLALERHATSKIASATDLNQLRTLGFRGEALPSIAAVSQLTLETASQPGDGTRVVVHFGRCQGQEPCGHPRGTTVRVEKLFSRIPARLKFLRSSATELRHIVETIQALGFAYPEVALVLSHNARKLVHLTPTKDRASRLFQLLGGPSPTPTEVQSSGMAAEVFLLPPTPSHQLVVAINRRVVKDRFLSGALARALRSVKGDWQADLFLHLDVPPSEVDFNVHPAKAEVRFANPGKVMTFLTENLRLALEKKHGATVVQVTRPSPWTSLSPSLTPASQPFRVAEPSPWQRPSFPREFAEPEHASLHEGRYLGQYRATYLLVETSQGLQLIDQHVAHERVLYERLLSRTEKEPSQALLLPEIIELSPSLYALVMEHRQNLLEAGIELEVLSGNTIRLVALPAGIPVSQAQSLVLGVLEDLSGTPLFGQSFSERIAASLACQAAIKKNTPLAAEQAQQLLRDLLSCRDPHRCPHGRPVVLLLPHEEIERRVGRRGG